MRKIYIILTWLTLFSLEGWAQSSSQNYIRIVEPTKSLTEKSSYTPEEALISIDYFDGLGRSTEQIQRGVTPSKGDLVTLTEYDSQGRVNKQWIPTAVASNNGNYITPATFSSKAVSFHNDAYAYQETVYEESPINRVVSNIGTGQTWRDNYRRDRISYLVNDNTTKLQVAKYIVNNTTSLKKDGNYATGELTVTQLWDEDLRYTLEFTDRNGRVVLIRKISANVNHDTYYVYDHTGRLHYVLPPMCSDQLTANQTFSDTHTAIVQYAYVKKYDKKGRCISNKLPGAEAHYYVYDMNDKLILSQTGNQRSASKWLFIKYDDISRPVITGEAVITGKTHTQLQDEYGRENISVTVDRDVPFYTTSGKGYMNVAKPMTQLTYHTVMYYDSYDFLPTSSALQYVSHTKGDAALIKSNGLVTGMLTFTLDGSNEMIVTALYYDAKGRVVQERSTNLVGGNDYTYTKYDFRGNPTSIYKQHLSSYAGTVEETYTNTYDHAGRLTKSTHKLGAQTARTINTSTYNELGQLKSKKMDAIAAINYTYHLRNWLKSINTTHFQQTNYYEEKPSGSSNTSFTGNITESTLVSRYNTSTGSQGTITENFIYRYDQLNRLTQSSHKFTMGGTTYSHYEGFSYDKHGNIKTLSREYKGRPEDVLTFQHTGNQLKSAFDEYLTSSSYENEFIQFTGKTYLSGQTYFYDKNGNLTKDLYREVKNIDYNTLNLPNHIESEGGNMIYYTYLADGTRSKARYVTNAQTMILPMGAIADEYMALSNSVSEAFADISLRGDSTMYSGNYIYENGRLVKILFSEGYIDYNPTSKTGTYCYYLKDHLGSNRVVVNQSNLIIQTVSYFASGIPIYNGLKTPKDKYLHTGKEFEQMHGLNWYDNGARPYDPITGRFPTMDPLGEEAYEWSPYSHCKNNFINRIDPDGRMDDWVYMKTRSDRAQLLTNSKQEYIKELKSNNLGDQVVTKGAITVMSMITATAIGAEIVGLVQRAKKVTEKVLERVDTNSQDTRTAEDPLRRNERTKTPEPDPEAKGTNHTQLGTKKGSKGKYRQTREFNEKNEVVRDIDHTDHGRPNDHPPGNKHQHKYIENSTGGTPQRGKPEPLDF